MNNPRSMEGRRLGDVAKELRACHSGGGLSQAAKAREPSMHVFLIDAWAQRSILGGRRKLEVKPWATVREVKNGIAKLLRIPPQRQQLRAPASADARADRRRQLSLTPRDPTASRAIAPFRYFRSAELADHRTLEASGVHHSGATLLFDARPELTESDEAALEPVSCAALHGGDGALPPTLGRALLRARRALVVGQKAPELAMDGTGGTYFLPGLDGAPQACFKPADEEPFCANNPRLFVGTAMPGTREAPEAEMRRGVRPGEAAKREVAAYLLDARNGGGAGVPETTLAKSRHRGYEYHDRVVADKRRGAGKKEHDLKLVPIDHGFCLPEVLSIEWFDWCWIDWPALSAPVCEPLKAQIAQLDADDDAAALRDALDIRPKSARLMVAATELLKRGVAAGLTLRDVAMLIVLPEDASSKTGKLATAVAPAAELADLAFAETHALGGALPRGVPATIRVSLAPPEEKVLGDLDFDAVSAVGAPHRRRAAGARGDQGPQFYYTQSKPIAIDCAEAWRDEASVARAHADGQPLAPSASKPGIAASRSGLFSDGRVLGRAKSADAATTSTSSATSAASSTTSSPGSSTGSTTRRSALDRPSGAGEPRALRSGR
ncbi:1-phosphatidylinositol 4-kinase [Aureococcus anophagefferens]|nr:1-phosphatidylinositol 4-kinase [Aureococcus anophagefferens]